MRADELAGLFTSTDDRSTVRFRQGVVSAWDQSTGANTITVDGADLTNVPILSTGEAISLRPGHVVGLLVADSQWFIIGRITPPGSADFAGSAVSFANVRIGAVGISAPLYPTTASVVSASVPVPPWADEAAVLSHANISIANSTANPQTMVAFSYIEGVHSGGIASTTIANSWMSATASNSRVLTTAGGTLGTTITLAGHVGTYLSAISDPNSLALLSALVIFRNTT